MFTAVFLGGLLLLGACSVDTAPDKKEVSLPSETFSFGKLMYDHFDSYAIKPGDELDVLFQIDTWQDMGPYRIAKDDQLAVKFPTMPELDETQPVRPDGMISLPYLGQIKVQNLTVAELTKKLKARYAKILRNPEVYVTVPETLSQLRELKQDLHTAPRGLSRLVTVAPDGVATFPMVGHILVSGRTIPEVNDQLNKFYAKVSPILRVDLFLEKHSGAVVYVMGEVRRSGAYAIERPISVAEALALAGGETHEASLGEVLVIRRHGEKMVARRVNLAASLSRDTDSPFFRLAPDDVVYVPRSKISTGAQLMTELGQLFWFRGWGGSVDYLMNNPAPGTAVFP